MAEDKSVGVCSCPLHFMTAVRSSSAHPSLCVPQSWLALGTQNGFNHISTGRHEKIKLNESKYMILPFKLS